MNETMLNLVIQLFQETLHQKRKVEDVFHDLHDKLNTARCEPEDFLALLTWLETFYSEDQAHTIKEQTRNAVRFYTPTEQAKMPAAVRHYLTQLYQTGTIDMGIREHIIEQIMALDMVQINVEHLKWIALLAFIHHNALDQFQHSVEKFIEFYHTLDMD